MKMTRWIVMLLAAALLVGCGEESGGETTDAATGGEPQQFRFAFNGKPRPDNVGLVLATPHFSDSQEVIPHETLTPGRAFPYAANGVVDVSVAHLPELVRARDRGVKVVAIGSLITEPTTSLIWLGKSKIDDIADLKGKTIAIPGLRYEKSFLESFLAQAGLTLADVELESVEYDLLPALVSGRADAIFGGSWSVEGAELEARGLEPVITRVEDMGAPSYEELVLVIREDRLARSPQSVRDFIAAMAAGTADALADPEAAQEVVAYRMDRVPGRASEAEFEATMPLLSESGEMSEEKASQLVDWMYEQGLIKEKQPVSEILTNEYLPEP
jgi:putative hydroxymethylpyrimidine transport system substrate-binding protein